MTDAAPTVVLVPMTEEEFAAYLPVSVEDFAQECLRSGRTTDPERAREMGRQSVIGALPDGLATKDHFVYAVVDAASGERVGSLWLALRDRDGAKEAFIYDIRMDAARRGMGYGRATMLSCIERARELGAPNLGLHVFGHAAVPRALYTSLGFVETDVMMSLPLDRTASHR